MTEYGRERERRRRRRSLQWLGYVVVMDIILALKLGPVLALAGLAGLLALAYAVITLIIWRDRRAELRRRASGESPTWSAQLPLMVARQFDVVVPGRHSRGSTWRRPASCSAVSATSATSCGGSRAAHGEPRARVR